MTQEGARLTVTLSDADFIVTNGRGNSFVGFLDPTDMIRFSIGDLYYYYFSTVYDIAERLSGTALLVEGIASGRGTAALISGTLKGYILISQDANPPFRQFSSHCYSENHAFEMVRR